MKCEANFRKFPDDKRVFRLTHFSSMRDFTCQIEMKGRKYQKLKKNSARSRSVKSTFFRICIHIFRFV